MARVNATLPSLILQQMHEECGSWVMQRNHIITMPSRGSNTQFLAPTHCQPRPPEHQQYKHSVVGLGSSHPLPFPKVVCYSRLSYRRKKAKATVSSPQSLVTSASFRSVRRTFHDHVSTAITVARPFSTPSPCRNATDPSRIPRSLGNAAVSANAVV